MEYYNMSAQHLVVSDLQQETDAEIMLYSNNNIWALSDILLFS